MRDGSVLRKVVSERHGAQRKRVGWTEDDLRREFEIIRATVFAAQRLLAKLLDGAEQASLCGYRLAALEQSRKVAGTS
ncbi:MAG TPA: hypothetical protein VES88_07720 [Gemmatimonadaceae bacterium]|nr:hypothetical protein [Gemmatimonadaceae bacterium]